MSSSLPETEAAVLEAVRDGDAASFATLAEGYRQQLHVHCYRMLGSFDDAEDMVQETLLRAWRARATFEGRSRFGTWLYRIATNACLNALQRAPRRVLPQDAVAPVTASTSPSQARGDPPLAFEVPWLQPYPDSRLEPTAPRENQPEVVAVARETLELAFLVALQHLPPRQRAVLILRDMLDWSARETADLTRGSVASVNSAHQRARATMRAHLASTRDESLPLTSTEVTPSEQEVLQAFMQAWQEADTQRMIDMLTEDARWAMPPAALWFDGRPAIERLYTLYPIDFEGRAFSMLATSANRQPAAAAYLRAKAAEPFVFSALHVLRVRGGRIAEVTTFGPELCRAFDLPSSLA